MFCKSLLAVGVLVSSALAAPIEPKAGLNKTDTSSNVRAVQHDSPPWDPSPMEGSPYMGGPGGEAIYLDDRYRPSYESREYPSGGMQVSGPWSRHGPEEEYEESMSDYRSGSRRGGQQFSERPSRGGGRGSSDDEYSDRRGNRPSRGEREGSSAEEYSHAQEESSAARQSNSERNSERHASSQKETSYATSSSATTSWAGALAQAPKTAPQVQRSGIWQPAVGAKYQIVLSEPIDTKSMASVSRLPEILPSDAQIFDIDLFDNDLDDFKAMKSAGKKIICYFSAGTWEKARPDTDKFPASVKGSGVKRNNFGAYWDELWVDIRSPIVLDVMKSRIALAASKGCDAIDPDNVDAFDSDNSPIGFPIQKSDAVTYLKWMADEAAKYGMGMGLKNAMDVLDDVQDHIQFAVNEQCVQSDECNRYHNFLQGGNGRVGKPVFHIEYVDDDSKGPVTPGRADKNLRTVNIAGRLMETLCMKLDGSRISQKFSTVIKEMELGGWVQFCDGKEATTVTRGKAGGSSRGGRGSSDSSDSSDNYDSAEMESSADSHRAMQGSHSSSATSASSASSSTSSTAGSMLSSLGNGLASLLGFGSSAANAAPASASSAGRQGSSGYSSSSGRPSSSGYSGARNSPSSSSASSASSSSSIGGWFSSIFTPKAQHTPNEHQISNPSSGSGGFLSGLGSILGWNKPAYVSAPVAAPPPAAAPCKKSTSWNPLAMLNPANWGSKSC